MESPRNLWQGSRIAQWITRRLTRYQAAVEDGCARIRRRAAWQAAAQTWRTAPLRAGGTLLITAVLTNWACLWIVGRRPDLVGVVQRLLLLTIGALAAGRTGDWAAVQQGSWLLRRRE